MRPITGLSGRGHHSDPGDAWVVTATLRTADERGLIVNPALVVVISKGIVQVFTHITNEEDEHHRRGAEDAEKNTESLRPRR